MKRIRKRPAQLRAMEMVARKYHAHPANTITPEDFRHLAKDFGVKLPEKFLFEK